MGRHVYHRTVVSVSEHYTNPTKRVGLVKSRLHHHLIENQLVLVMIQLKNIAELGLNNNHSLTRLCLCFYDIVPCGILYVSFYYSTIIEIFTFKNKIIK